MITGNEQIHPSHSGYENHANGDGVAFVTHEGGITIRQHFANSAPDNIPDWFVHVPPAGITIKRPELPKDAPKEHIHAVCVWREFDAELPDELKWFNEAWGNYLNAINKWEYDNKKERYFQWRTFYAENLIAELNKPATNE